MITLNISKEFYGGKECVLVEDLPHFDLTQIMNSGQCFRMKEIPTDCPDASKSFSVCWGLWHVQVDELNRPAAFLFRCTMAEFAGRWFKYFALDYDYYDNVLDQLCKTPDAFLSEALEYGSGIRILNQGLWEALICFLISQNNNIKRITKTVDSLCVKYGELCNDRGVEYYSFPSPCALMGADFENLGLGYRKNYFEHLFDIAKAAEFANWYCMVSTSEYNDAKRLLMQVKGIGTKVADCICLYGLNQTQAYPIDTWMKKLINQVYHGAFDESPYKMCAGYVQQLQFFYFRSKELTKQLREWAV